MYITRVILNVRREAAREVLMSPYRTHAVVEAACGKLSDLPREPSSVILERGRVLWRVDYDAGDVSKLYIVSPGMPDADVLLQKTSAEDVEIKDYEPRLDSIEAGQAWAFRLKSNPARKVAVDKGNSPQEYVVGSIRGHVTYQQQLDWLLSRSEKWGFRVPVNEWGQPQVGVSNRRKERFRRGDATVTIATAVYDGALEVIDAGLFRNALCRGLGRAKGFGCGLMTIASLRDA